MGLTDTAVASATLTVTIEEKCLVTNVNRGSKTTLTVAGITDMYTRIVGVPTAGTELAQFAASPGSGTFKTSTKYIRITNKDATNFVTLNFYDHATASSANDLFAIKLEAGKSFMLGSTLFDASVSDSDGLLTVDQTITVIKAQANTAACDVEIVIGEG